MIEFKDFSGYYKVKPGYLAALDELNLTVRDGELLAIVGESGSGKTTFLKCVLNQCEHTSGELLIDGIPVQQVDRQSSLFAYVSQEYILYPQMLIYENIAYPLRVMHTPQEEVDRRVRQTARELGLEYLLNRKPRQLSGGQHQRVALARALIKHPRYLLLDEPFSNVDPEVHTQMRELIRTIHRTYDTTILFVTHDLAEAFALADQILVLEDGKAIQHGTPRELRTNPQSELLRRFLQS